jgi:hypothetical protein
MTKSIKTIALTLILKVKKYPIEARLRTDSIGYGTSLNYFTSRND